jgi:drug/metabolite transporter (DMT)-like permease
VGVLFLLVLLLVTGWSVSPLAAAAAVSILPATAIAASRIPGPPRPRACAGALLLAGGVSGALRPAMGLEAWAWTAAIAVGSTVVPLSAFLAGVARLGPSRTSILAMLEPPLVCVLAFLAFGERLAPLQLLGGGLVVGAALALQLRPLRSLRRGAPAQTADHPPARALAREPA